MNYCSMPTPFCPDTRLNHREFQKRQNQFYTISPGVSPPKAGVTMSIPASNKTLGSLMMSSFTSEYLTMSEYFTRCFSK